MSDSSHLIRIKGEIASSYPDFEECVTQAWADILVELKKMTQEISAGGSEVSSFISNSVFYLTITSSSPKSSSLNLRAFQLIRLMKSDARDAL